MGARTPLTSSIPNATGIKLWIAVQRVWVFLAGNQIICSQCGRSLRTGKSRQRDREQVQYQILINISQQPPDPGPSGPPPKPKHINKKPRRVNNTVYSNPPDPKHGKGPKEDQRGSRPITSPTVPTKLMPPTYGIPLASEPTTSPDDIPNPLQVALESPPPVLRKKAFLKPPPQLCQVHYSRVHRP